MKRTLSLNSLSLIKDFLKPTPRFYLVDMGSSIGTYIRVRPDKERLIENENIYLIGAESQFYICGLLANAKNKQKNKEYFFESISREVSNGAILHGMENEELSAFQSNKKKRKFIYLTTKNSTSREKKYR